MQATNFMNACLPYMKNIVYVIDSYLPPMAISRNEKLQETMREALKLLDKDAASVEDFFDHLSVLAKINNDLPRLEKEFDTVTQLFKIAQDFNLSIDAESYAFFKSLAPIFQNLKVIFVDWLTRVS